MEKLDFNGWIDFLEQRPAPGQLIVFGYLNNVFMDRWGDSWSHPICWYPVPEPPFNLDGGDLKIYE